MDTGQSGLDMQGITVLGHMAYDRQTAPFTGAIDSRQDADSGERLVEYADHWKMWSFRDCLEMITDGSGQVIRNSPRPNHRHWFRNTAMVRCCTA